MRDTIRRIGNFAVYLLPIFLLATASALLMGLLYYPTASTPAADYPPRVASAIAHDRQTRADALLAILLADALRQFQMAQAMEQEMEQETRTRILIYPYETDTNLAEESVTPHRTPPAPVKSRAASRPVLIHL